MTHLLAYQRVNLGGTPLKLKELELIIDILNKYGACEISGVDRTSIFSLAAEFKKMADKEGL